MGTIIDYVSGEMRTFKAKPFTRVDSLVLCELAYFHWQDVRGVPSQLRLMAPPRLKDLYRAEEFAKLFPDLRDNDRNHTLFAAIAASPRFRDVKLTYHVDSFDESIDKQFSATTFVLPDSTTYVAFRGTDMSMVGWKEDFELAYISPVPSQEAAHEYLQKVAEHTRGPLIVGGHSKGGNLAVYAAGTSGPKIRDRIPVIYSHDGPGFPAQVLRSARFSRIAPLIDKTVPESSMIGMLLEQQEAYRIVEANAVGFDQHDPHTWVIKGDDFVYGDKISPGAEYFNTTFGAWIDELSLEQRKEFTDSLFGFFEASGVKTFQELRPSNFANSAAYLKDMDPDMRKKLFDVLGQLATLSLQNLVPNRVAETAEPGKRTVEPPVFRKKTADPE